MLMRDQKKCEHAESPLLFRLSQDTGGKSSEQTHSRLHIVRHILEYRYYCIYAFYSAFLIRSPSQYPKYSYRFVDLGGRCTYALCVEWPMAIYCPEWHWLMVDIEKDIRVGCVLLWSSCKEESERGPCGREQTTPLTIMCNKRVFSQLIYDVQHIGRTGEKILLHGVRSWDFVCCDLPL